MSFIEKNRRQLEKGNYVLKATHENNYWFGLEKSKIEQLKKAYGNEFSIIVFGSSMEGDFYKIPFKIISHALTTNSLGNTTNRKRWVGDIKFHQLSIRNCTEQFDLSKYYGALESSHNAKYIVENDYSIENRKIEINGRLKQSKFRKTVLRNYNYKCCISGIGDKHLLVASHIIPWSQRIDTRLDPSNGLSLFILFDKLFDLGYISIDPEWKLMISNRIMNSPHVLQFVAPIKQRKIDLPQMSPPKQNYLEFHRNKIFQH